MEGSFLKTGQAVLKRRQDLIVAIALAVGTLALLWPSRTFDVLNYDDPAYLNGEGHVVQGLTWEGIQWALTERHFVIPVPLTWLSLMANTSLLGYTPGSFRVVNILIHILNALLVYALARALCGRRVIVPIVVAIIFAWHPTRLESVIWISERKDVLSIFFLLLTLLGYLHYGRKRTLARYLGCVLLPFLLSLGSKPSTVVIPALIMLLDFWPLRRLGAEVGPEGFSWRRLLQLFRDLVRALPDKLPLLAAAVAVVFVTWTTAHDQGATVPWDQFTLVERVTNLPITYGLYAFRLLYPFELALFIPHSFQVPALWPALMGLAFLLAGTWLAFTQMWRCRLAFVGWVMFIGILIPVSGLLQNGGQLIAFRYTYLPYVGLTLFWGALLGDWLGRRLSPQGEGKLWPHPGAATVRYGSVVLVAIFCIVGTLIHQPTWTNSLTVWQYALLVTKKNYVAVNNIVSPLVAAGAVREAQARAKRATEWSPSNDAAILNLASTSLSAGQVKAADALFTALEPRLVKWLDEKGYNTANFGVDREAIQKIYIKPVDLAAQAEHGRQMYLRALAAALNHRPEVAERFLDAALWIDQSSIQDFTAFSLAGHLEVEGYDPASARLYQALKEELPQTFFVLARGALLFALSQDEAVRNPAMARAWFSEALHLGPGHEAVIAAGGVLYDHLEGRQAAEKFVREALAKLDEEHRARAESLWVDYQQDPETTLRRLRGWPRHRSESRRDSASTLGTSEAEVHEVR